MKKKIISYMEENASLMSKKVRKQWTWVMFFNILYVAMCIPVSAVLQCVDVLSSCWVRELWAQLAHQMGPLSPRTQVTILERICCVTKQETNAVSLDKEMHGYLQMP